MRPDYRQRRFRSRHRDPILRCLVGDTTPRLRRVGPCFEGGTYIRVLTHPELRSTARVRAFVDYVREMIGSDCGLISGVEP